MKRKLNFWLLAVACLATAPATALFAAPQTKDVTITAIVTADDGQAQSSDELKGDKPKDDQAKSDQEGGKETAGPQKRQSIRLRFNNGPVVLMKRVALPNDDASAKDGDEANAGDRDSELKDAAPPKIWLGIGLKGVEGDLATYLGSSEGVFIESVLPDSPAAEAKLQEGDVVVAFQGQKVSSPGALVEALHAVKVVESESKDEAKAAAYPRVALTILRRGQEMKVEVTPRRRPADVKVTRAAEGDDLAEVTNIFKFGQPGQATLNLVKPFNKTVSNIVVVVKEDGKEYIARVERNGDEPAKIVVTEGKDERQVSEDQLDQLPEKVREAIKNALKANGGQLQFKSGDANDGGEASEQAFDEIREQLEKAMKQVGGGKIDIELKDLAESLKAAGQGRVIIVDPDKLPDVRKMTEDAKSMAKKWAEVGAEQARGFSKMPEQIKDLKQQVDDLRKQVEELRDELKASKK